MVGMKKGVEGFLEDVGGRCGGIFDVFVIIILEILVVVFAVNVIVVSIGAIFREIVGKVSFVDEEGVVVEEDAAEGTGDDPVGISALMVVPFGHIGEEGIVEVDTSGGIGIFDGGEDERGGPPTTGREADAV